jgi:hypothetical protein
VKQGGEYNVWDDDWSNWTQNQRHWEMKNEKWTFGAASAMKADLSNGRVVKGYG